MILSSTQKAPQRHSVYFLGGVIAEGCDHILADAGCYALPYVENELKELSKQYIQEPLTIEKVSLGPGDFMAMFLVKPRCSSSLILMWKPSCYPTLPAFLPNYKQARSSISSCGLMTNWNY